MVAPILPIIIDPTIQLVSGLTITASSSTPDNPPIGPFCDGTTFYKPWKAATGNAGENLIINSPYIGMDFDRIYLSGNMSGFKVLGKITGQDYMTLFDGSDLNLTSTVKCYMCSQLAEYNTVQIISTGENTNGGVSISYVQFYG